MNAKKETPVNFVRRRLTYASVMSSIAVFLVLGGAAFAATQLPKNSVGTKQLKKNAVNGSKVKDGSLTGADLNLSTLGTVPSATNANHATSADTATNATNANHANIADKATALASPVVQPFKFFANGTQSATILAVTGAVFEATCTAGTLDEAGTKIKGTADNGIAKVEGVDETQAAFNNSQDALNTGETVSLLHEATSNEVAATATYMGAGGSPNVSVVYGTESNQPPGIGAQCLIWGTAQTP